MPFTAGNREMGIYAETEAYFFPHKLCACKGQLISKGLLKFPFAQKNE